MGQTDRRQGFTRSASGLGCANRVKPPRRARIFLDGLSAMPRERLATPLRCAGEGTTNGLVSRFAV
jgi:hypothetical protein